MDMDIDLDLFDDKIKDFLLNKLEEVKANNEGLQKTLGQREQFFKDEFQDSQMQMDDACVKVDPNYWKKIFNNKYAIGLKLETDVPLEFLKLIMLWDSSIPLLYKVHIYNEDADHVEDKNKSETILRDTIVVVTFQVPEFVDQHLYTVSGNIFLKQNNKEVLLSLPGIKISSRDQINHQLFDWSVSRENLPSLLTIISCSEETRLLMVFPDDYMNNIDTTFEIDCGFVKLKVDNNRARNYYFSHKVSYLFDNSLIAVGISDNRKSFSVSVFTRNYNSLLSLLHYIHASIPGIIILPEAYSANYKMRNTTFSNELSKDFKDSVRKEIGCARKFLQELSSQGTNVDRKRISEFRSKLSKFEDNTDALYVKILHMNR